MANQEKITIILPTRNRASWLQATIDSILVQSFKQFSLIVIDDGSNDSTPFLLKKTKQRDSRIQIHRTSGVGVSAARNHGIKTSQSELIAFIDSDDHWLPEKLSLQIKELKKIPNAALCHCDEIWIRKGIRVNPCQHHEKMGGWIFNKCLPRCVISPSATLIYRKILTEVGFFDETLPACEDYDLWLRITHRYPVAFVKKPLVIKHGGHSDQLSKKYPLMDVFRIKALKKLLKEKTLSEEQKTLVHRMIIKKSEIIAKGADKRKNFNLARTYWRTYQESLKFKESRK